jgi:hypothetical protein
MLIPKYRFKIEPREAAPSTCDFTILTVRVSNDRKLVDYRSAYKQSCTLDFARGLAEDLREVRVEVDDEAKVEEPEGCL